MVQSSDHAQRLKLVRGGAHTSVATEAGEDLAEAQDVSVDGATRSRCAAAASVYISRSRMVALTPLV